MSKLTVGNRISHIRRLKKITQQQLADGIGILRTSLSQIENGLYAPSSETMLKISDHLNMPLGDIFFNPNVSIFDTKRKYNDRIPTNGA